MKRIFFVISFAFICFGTIFSSIPSGYYSLANGKKKAELKTVLHNIISQATMFGYGGGEGKSWNGFFLVDKKSDGSVFDMYSNDVRYFDGYNSVTGMHIEHSLPKSWWGGAVNNAYKDLYHLYPSEGSINISKSNLPLGEVATVATTNGVSKVGVNGFGTDYTGRCFEPADEYKGDFARSYFYVVTAYENFKDMWVSPMMDNNTYPVWKPWAIDLLLKWHRQDPVSEKELARIEGVFSIQGNRNPFIDYPSLAEYIWGTDTLKTFVSTTVESQDPTLISPFRWTKSEFGAVPKNESREIQLLVKGVNMSTDVTLSYLIGNAGFSVSHSTLTKTQVEQGQNITITFSATNIEGLFVDTLKIAGGGLLDPLKILVEAKVASNFKALEATDVTATTFNANWTEASFAEKYLLSVFTFSGSGLLTDVQTFDNIGATGTPLPDGWTGTLSGNYTSTANSGNNIPAAGMKSNNEYLQTKSFSSPITNLSFMAKYVLGDTGSHLILEGNSNGVWTGLDTLYWENNTKFNPAYVFQSSQNISAIRFTYKKVKGNLALDDILITYGKKDTVYVFKNKEISSLSHKVLNLSPQTTYYYNLRAASDDTSSDYSNVIQVVTQDVGVSFSPILKEEEPLLVYSINKKIVVHAAVDSEITVFNVFGKVVSHLKIDSSPQYISIYDTGLYLVRVGGKTYKIMIF